MQFDGDGLDCSAVRWFWPGLQCSVIVMLRTTVQCGVDALGCSKMRWYWPGFTVQCGSNVLDLQCSAVVMGVKQAHRESKPDTQAPPLLQYQNSHVD